MIFPNKINKTIPQSITFAKVRGSCPNKSSKNQTEKVKQRMLENKTLKV